MERDRQQGDHDGRALLTLALAALVGVTAAAFGRIFQGSGVTMQLILAGVVAVSVAALLERRSLALSLVVSAAALALLLGLILFPRTTWVIFPTGATFEALARALGNLGRQAVEQPAPAPAIPSLLSASLIAVWSAAYASHALAARAGSPILALAPAATLLAFAEVVMEDGPRPGYAAAFLVAGVLVLFSAGIRGLRGWGPLLPRRTFGSTRLATGPIGRGAQTMGIAATAAALLAPGILPGFRADPLLEIGSGSTRIAISPLVDIRPNLHRDEPVELFRVRSLTGSYWRLLSLDRYSGRVWSASDPQAEQGAAVSGAAALPVASVGGQALDQQFELTNLGGTWLPAAYQPLAVDVPAALRFDPDAITLVTPDGIPGDLRYSVRSELVVPTQEQLDRPVDYAVSGVPDKYFELPAETPPEIHDFAVEITAGAQTPFREALAIQNYFRGFTYDQEAPPGHGIDDLRYFLRSKRGYCEQFAGAMAVFLRSLGFPSRVVVGFTEGVRRPDGLWHVTTEDAHAWVEMYFPGFGWLAFEPTPSRVNPVSAPYLASTAGTVGSTRDLSEAAIVGRRNAAAELDIRLGRIERQLGGFPEPINRPERRAWPIAIGVGAGLLAVALALRPVGRALSRRRRLRRATGPRERVLAAYEVFEARAGDLGLGRSPAETPAEYRERLRAAVTMSSDDLERLTEIATRALYTPTLPGRADADAATVAMSGAGADLRRHVGLRRALVAWVRPAAPPRRARGSRQPVS
ncbi:MAG TPA: DUF3488 and transglutaminase-like domain-containing protein [Actinomycetota bacterium]